MPRGSTFQKPYPPEFRREAVELYRQSGKPLREIAVDRRVDRNAADLGADLRTWEGWLYLAVMLDCDSRRVVGWSIADHLRSELVVDALEMAVDRSRPNRVWYIATRDPGTSRSRSDNDAAEQASNVDGCMGLRLRQRCLRGVLQDAEERTHRPPLLAQEGREARHAVFDFIETFYNRRRRHSTLGYLSPDEYGKNATET